MSILWIWFTMHTLVQSRKAMLVSSWLCSSSQTCDFDDNERFLDRFIAAPSLHN